MSPKKSTESYHYSVAEIKAMLDKGLENIMATYSRASLFTIKLGLEWYKTACEEAQDIATRYDLPIETVVKVACALSPKMEWTVNMKAAEFYIRYYIAGGYVPSIEPYANGTAYIQHTAKGDIAHPEKPCIADDPNIPQCPYGGLKSNAVKALWILQGHDWVLRGPKVSAFLDNILRWNDSQLVTVDSHAIQVWFGSIDGGTYSIPENYMTVIAADYQRAAALLGISPLQVQAVTWIQKKAESKFSKR